MQTEGRSSVVLGVLAASFLSLTAAFCLNLWGGRTPRQDIPLVDPALLKPDTFRQSYAQRIAAKEDLSDFDCYACHDKGKPPPIRYDANHNIIVPAEHAETIVMGHGSHDRNNLCFNCHDEHNLELLQTRDGRQLKLYESAPLCGSCHGPTYRDWEAGVHGRTGGYWDEALGKRTRQICVDCHNPHKPKIPGRKPLPPPHALRAEGGSQASQPQHEH
jgi:hypothetical protein